MNILRFVLISEGRIGDGIGNGKKNLKTLSDEELVKAAQKR